MDNAELLKAIREVVKSEIQPLKDDILELKQGQIDLQQGQTDLQQDVLSIKMTLEHEVRRSINLLCEGHTGMVEKVDIIASDVELIKDKLIEVEAMARH